MAKRLSREESARQDVGAWLISLVPAILKVRGVSGKEYIFSGAGSKVYVDAQDTDELLKMYRRPCDCSSVRGVRPYFEKLLEV